MDIYILNFELFFDYFAVNLLLSEQAQGYGFLQYFLLVDFSSYFIQPLQILLLTLLLRTAMLPQSVALRLRSTLLLLRVIFLCTLFFLLAAFD